MTNTIQIKASDGAGFFNAYIALPSGGTGPAVVALQEVFGVNAGMRKTCDWLASLGYIAICPDLFWRQDPGVQLSDKTEAEMQKALALYSAFDYQKGTEDIIATLTAARTMADKVGTIGYCLGGLLAYYTATRTDADVSVSYYGVGINQKLDEAKNINKPLLMHIAEEDIFVSKSQQDEIHEALDNNNLVTIHDYAGMNHAFARPDGIDWNADAAKLANNRTAEFLDKHLKA